jgi:hypothetical protein
MIIESIYTGTLSRKKALENKNSQAKWVFVHAGGYKSNLSHDPLCASTSTSLEGLFQKKDKKRYGCCLAFVRVSVSIWKKMIGACYYGKKGFLKTFVLTAYEVD